MKGTPYKFDGTIYCRDGNDLDYSDPDQSEQRLLEVIAAVTDLSVGSEELAAQITDWPSYYHLAPQRVDLLRPIEHLLHGAILEVGSGCGAISPFLAQHAQSLTALEGSRRRAKLTAMRCRGLPNVSVYCDNFQDSQFDRRFDVVTSIGVLEYAGCYFDAPYAFDRLAEVLAPEGVLIIAIENRLGLKYLAGAPEDHTGRPFDGVTDVYRPDSVLTLGREELNRRIDSAGMEIGTWLYPWPDYKSPELIVSEAAFREIERDLARWLLPHTIPFQGRVSRSFSEALAWSTVVENGLGQALANSFVVVARHRGNRASTPVEPLVWEYQTGRRRSNATAVHVVKRAGRFWMERQRLYPDATPAPKLQIIVPSREVVPDEPMYDAGLFRILSRERWTVAMVAQWASPWLQFLRALGPSANSVGLPPGRFVRDGAGLRPWGMELVGCP